MGEKIIIDILGHADFSGRLRKSKSSPGLAAFCASVDSVRDGNPQGTLLLDSGDEFGASYWPGFPVVKALSLIGTDAMTLGNHEFDRGKGFLEECIGAAAYPILCANIAEKATGELVRGVLPYVILERSGVKVGILGLTTEYTPYMIKYPAFEPYRVTSSVEACNLYIPQMRGEGAQIIVLLTHFPFYVDEHGGISGELYDVLCSVPPVDVCIGGHIPGDYAGVVCGAAVMKAGFAGESLGHARLWFDAERNRVADVKCEIMLTDPEAVGSESVLRYVDEAVAPYSAYLDEVLAIVEEEAVMRLSCESKLGNFFADCLLEGGGTQISYMNATSAGGIVAPGPLTVEDITGCSRFNEYLMTTRMTGRQIYRLFELVYEPERFGCNGCLCFSGIVAYLDHTKPSPCKVSRITLPDGTPLDPDALYSVTANEYMASGGNDTSEIARAVEWESSGLLNHDAIFRYLRKHGGLRTREGRRLHEIGSPENDNTPF